MDLEAMDLVEMEDLVDHLEALLEVVDMEDLVEMEDLVDLEAMDLVDLEDLVVDLEVVDLEDLVEMEDLVLEVNDCVCCIAVWRVVMSRDQGESDRIYQAFQQLWATRCGSFPENNSAGPGPWYMLRSESLEHGEGLAPRKQ